MTQRHPIQQEHLMLLTAVTYKRVPHFQKNAHAREAVETLYRVQQLHLFFLYAFVVMPDHCHFLVRIPAPETAARIMTVYKSGLTFNIGIPKMWQSRFHIRLIEDGSKAMRYVHLNPVSAGLSETAEEYPWSSASGRWDTTPLEF